MFMLKIILIKHTHLGELSPLMVPLTKWEEKNQNVSLAIIILMTVVYVNHLAFHA